MHFRVEYLMEEFTFFFNKIEQIFLYKKITDQKKSIVQRKL